MPRYHFNSTSLIDQVTFVENEAGASRAYIHANEGMNSADVAAIKQALCKKELICLPNTVNGQPVLEIRGFSREKDILSALIAGNWIKGGARKQEDIEVSIPLYDKFRKRSLQASGAFMALADVGFMMYGAKERKWEDTLAGLSYLSGSTVLGMYGRLDESDLRIREMAQLIVSHAKEKGLHVPENSALDELSHKKKEGVLRKVHNLFREYPSEVGNMFYVLAGALITKSALHHHALAPARPGMRPEQIHDMRKEGWQDAALGTSTMISGSIATLVKEKAEDPDSDHKKGAEGWFEKIKRKPLTLASIGYIGSTMCHAMSTYTAYTRAKKDIGDRTISAAERAVAENRIKSVPWRALFVGSTLIGELLLAISSKGHGEGVVHDNSVKDSVVSLAAELILKQPEHLQKDLTQYMAGYLGQPEVLALKNAEAEALLQTKIEMMRNNPWAETVVESSPSSVQADRRPIVSKSAENWREMVAMPPSQAGVSWGSAV